MLFQNPIPKNPDRLKKNVEEALQKSLKEASDYKYAPEEFSIVIITGQKGIIRYRNDNFCKTSKYSGEELIGQDRRIINPGCYLNSNPYVCQPD
jgi:PAS domain-containing protein